MAIFDGTPLYIRVILALGMLSFVFMFRPRKWPTYAYRNFISLTGFIIVIGCGITVFGPFVLTTEVYGEKARELPTWVYMSLAFSVLLLVILTVIYLIYWSIPSHQNWRRNRKVRDAIQRYKHRHESMGPPSLSLGWLPRLVVERKSYFLQLYHLGYDVSGILGVDEDGNVVRNLDLIKKLYRTYDFACEMSLPSAHDRRSSAYEAREKTYPRLQTLIANYEQLSTPLSESHETDRKRVYEAALIMRRVLQTNKRNDLLEATWAAKHRHVHLQEASYEEMLSMAAQRRKNTIWIMDEVQVILDGASSAKRLLKKIKAGDIKIHKDLNLLLNTVIEGRETALFFKEIGEANDETMPIYERMPDEGVEVWQERFKIIEKVDRGGV